MDIDHTITKEESIKCIGGSGTITAAFIAAAVSVFRLLYGFGQNLGSAVYRHIHNINC